MTGVRIGWWLSSEEHDPRRLVDHAVLAERSGVTTAMISDHLQPWVRHQGQSSHVWTVLGGIAQATSVLEVGTGVTALVHRSHPINVAQAAATAAVMFEDRFFLGIGFGERLNEQPFGARWPRAGERRDMVGEGIGVVRKLLDGGNVNHRGTVAVENLELLTRPAQRVPIHLAVGGARSAALAGEIADGMISVTPDARLVDQFHGSGGAGKPCLAQLHVSLAATRDAAIDQAWEWWPNGVVPPSLNAELTRLAQFEAVAEAVGRSSITDAVVCATDAGPVVQAIDRFVAAGYDTVYVHQVGPDQQRLADVLVGEILAHERG